MRRLSFFLAVLPAVSFAVTPIELTQQEFKMYRHWQNAMQDPRVQKMKPAKQNPAIAKDAKFKLKEMEAAIAKGEAAGDVKAACEANLKEALATGPIAGRVGTIEVDATEPHAVAYVNWRNENTAQLEEEASFIAPTAAKACPIASTITVWAVEGSSPKTRIFQALISREAAVRINVERAKDFADTRYIRLFEKVKNVAKGDVIEGADPAGGTDGAAAPTPAPAPAAGAGSKG